jgi:cellulose synthase/poly-beta-1,6-N-acetylglucosamine synthase-like glycosyltransferase
MTKLVLLLSLGVLLYLYAGYPLILELIVRIRGPRRILRGSQLPRVTLIISAYNEKAVIGTKLQNALALDYPRDRLEIVVVSDASSDGTDAIVTTFADQGVRLARQAARRGKTAGLNAVVPAVSGDIVVFSDANAMYEPDAVRKLVRNFADPRVGCVTGEARYLKGNRSAADVTERAYWTYEIWIKRLETAVGSMVGGDGAIYAIRKPLWLALPEDAINDFLNPLQIVGAGWRGVYEPEAICYEETAAGISREWRRRVRIVSRSWRAVFQAPGVLNPLRVGLFTFNLLSHKVLRWFSGVFLVLLAASAARLLILTALPDSMGIRVAAAVAFAIVASTLFRTMRRAFGLAVYFTAITVASLVGIVRGTLGNVSGVWTTPRAETPTSYVFRPGIPILLISFVGLATVVVALAFGESRVATVVFWAAVITLGYVYAGYPIVLRAWAALGKKKIAAAFYEPRVCLLIAAHDEAAVIGRKLENSLALDYPADRLRIVVASDGSQDGTDGIVRTFGSRVQLHPHFPRRGKIAAINDAMPSIDAEVVVLSDANTFLRRDAIRKLVRNFADPEVGAVSGDVVLTGERAALGTSEDLYYRYERHLQRLESEIGSLVGVDGALYALRTALFAPPPGDTILDDMAIPMAILRSGYRVVFEPEALAEEAGSGSASEEFWRKVRVVAGAVQFLIRPDSGAPISRVQALFTLISHKALRWMSPAFAGVAFIASARLAQSSGFFTAVLAAELGVVLLGAAGCVPFIRRIRLVALAHYFCLVQTAAAVGFARGLAGRQPVAWRRFARATVQPT